MCERGQNGGRNGQGDRTREMKVAGETQGETMNTEVKRNHRVTQIYQKQHPFCLLHFSFYKIKRDIPLKCHLAEVCSWMSSYSGVASYQLFFMFFDGLTHFGCLLMFIRRSIFRDVLSVTLGDSTKLWGISGCCASFSFHGTM